jgi:uncharacterized LabA/DUF88 family protein
MPQYKERAAIFIDGNNWYHSLKGAKVADMLGLDYARISQKLIGPRKWVGTRYYIGALKSHHTKFDDQRRFLSLLQNDDPARIAIRRGRIEDKTVENDLAKELLDFLRQRASSVPPALARDLDAMGRRHLRTTVLKEKAADVFLAVDLCRLAIEDAFDAAYLLSADGDYTPAVELVRARGKKVFAASPMQSGALSTVVNAYIPLTAAWFAGLQRPNRRPRPPYRRR